MHLDCRLEVPAAQHLAILPGFAVDLDAVGLRVPGRDVHRSLESLAIAGLLHTPAGCEALILRGLNLLRHGHHAGGVLGELCAHRDDWLAHVLGVEAREIAVVSGPDVCELVVLREAPDFAAAGDRTHGRHGVVEGGAADDAVHPDQRSGVRDHVRHRRLQGEVERRGLRRHRQGEPSLKVRVLLFLRAAVRVREVVEPHLNRCPAADGHRGEVLLLEVLHDLRHVCSTIQNRLVRRKSQRQPHLLTIGGQVTARLRVLVEPRILGLPCGGRVKCSSDRGGPHNEGSHGSGYWEG
mmetsp:Transcript_86766/g.248946  ORF Transcript_86766/g.248946 Transcript_86766/m.248946 type:complete len:295 (-) Transcript_86766:36-920(-)